MIHPAIAIVDYLKQRNFTGLVYTIGSPVFRSIIQAAGFKTIDGVHKNLIKTAYKKIVKNLMGFLQPHQMGEEKFSSMWKTIKDDQPVEAVAIDTDVNLAVFKLIRAQLYLNNPKCLFLVGTTDMLLSLGTVQLMGKY